MVTYSKHSKKIQETCTKNKMKSHEYVISKLRIDIIKHLHLIILNTISSLRCSKSVNGKLHLTTQIEHKRNEIRKKWNKLTPITGSCLSIKLASCPTSVS